MREIKFRAWDKKEKKFDTFDHYQDFAVFHYYPETPNIIEGKPMNQDLILQQFTGLLDKNGKEIYEGDVVDLYFNNIGKIIVKYKDGYFNISDYYLGECEIIGNIFENPDLLTSYKA